MPSLRRPIQLLLFLLPLSLLPAAEYVWPGHGTITFEVPATWTLRGRQAGDVGFNFKAVPNSKTAAVLQLTLADIPTGRPPAKSEELKGRLLDSVKQYVSGSVEKKATPVELPMKQGSGWYAQFTDASLVGKPPVPNDYKMMRSGLAALDDRAVVVATLQFDDGNGPEPAEMQAIVTSMRFQRSKTVGILQVVEKNGIYDISMPGGGVRLSFPKAGYKPTDSGNSDPSYFYLTDEKTGVLLSGWFEPASKFGSVQEFWKSESQGMKKQGMEPKDVSFGKQGEWDTILYEVQIGGANQTNLRAELVKFGQWIDLHLSITSDDPAAMSRKRLLGALQAIQIGGQ